MKAANPKVSLQCLWDWRGIALISGMLLLGGKTQGQVTDWIPVLVGDPFSVAGAQQKPILGTPLLSSGSPAQVPWTGALTSAPANLGAALGTETDGFGNSYTIYSVDDAVFLPSPYYGYVSLTTPGQTTSYFGLSFSPDLLAVDPLGHVFISSGPANGTTFYELSHDGSTTTVGTIFGGGIEVENGPMTVDAEDNISVEVSSNIPIQSNAVFFFEAIGPVPDFSAPIAPPSYPTDLRPTSSYTIPFSQNPTVSLTTFGAVSSLPISYQWYYDGTAIAGATLGTYNGPFIGDGTYSVVASTTGGTVASSATVNMTIGGAPGPAATATPVFSYYSGDVTINTGSMATLAASAGATLPVAFQWYLNGTAIPGADESIASPTTYGLYNTSYVTNQPGVYTVLATTTGNGGGSVTSSPATVTVTTSSGGTVEQIPSFTVSPQSISFSYGSIPELTAVADATLPITFQWQINGVNIPRANQATYSTGVSGSYTVVATTTAGSVTSSPAIVALGSRPTNISSRAYVGTGADVSIAGFVVSSYSGANKQLLVRAAGPALSEFNVTGVLAQPVLTVYDSAGNVVASNSGWNNSPEIAAAAASVGAFAFSAGSLDSALVLSLPPGNFTAQITGANGTTGIALIEVYEITADSGHLINISTRASVGTGADILIGGFVIGGAQSSQLLIRATGPGLAGYGVSGFLAQPILSVYDSSGNLVAVNVGWSNGGSAAAVAIADAAVTAGAFPLVPGSADSAVFLTLSPGSYTAQVTGVGGLTGIALVEVYQVPQ
jgi:hypothetical protein